MHLDVTWFLSIAFFCRFLWGIQQLSLSCNQSLPNVLSYCHGSFQVEKRTIGISAQPILYWTLLSILYLYNDLHKAGNTLHILHFQHIFCNLNILCALFGSLYDFCISNLHQFLAHKSIFQVHYAC